MHINHATALYLHSINIHKHIIKYITKKIPHVLINAYYFFSHLQAGANHDPYKIDIVRITSNYICVLITLINK
jgi:hypothetical protein